MYRVGEVVFVNVCDIPRVKLKQIQKKIGGINGTAIQGKVITVDNRSRCVKLHGVDFKISSRKLQNANNKTKTTAKNNKNRSLKKIVSFESESDSDSDSSNVLSTTTEEEESGDDSTKSKKKKRKRSSQSSDSGNKGKKVSTCGLGNWCLNVQSASQHSQEGHHLQGGWHKCECCGQVVHNFCSQAFGFEGEFYCKTKLKSILQGKGVFVAGFENDKYVTKEIGDGAIPNETFDHGADIEGENEEQRSDSHDSSDDDNESDNDYETLRVKVGKTETLEWKKCTVEVDSRIAAMKPQLSWPDGHVDNDRSPLAYFNNFFLADLDITTIIGYTNERLVKAGRAPLNGKNEFYVFLGIILASSFYPNLPREKLFSNGSAEFIVYPNLGRFMSLDRFNRIVSSLAFIQMWKDPQHNPQACLHKHVTVKVNGKEKNKLVHTWDAFQLVVDSFNRQRRSIMAPGKHLVVDEKMSKWRGKDDRFIEGNPSIRKIKRKPEPIGNEIQSCCCGESGICIRIEIASSKYSEPRPFDAGNSKGTAVVQRLVNEYAGSGRTVYGDSAFGSVNTAVRLMSEMGLNFIGVVKTCSKMFPQKQLRSYSFANRGDSVVYKTTVSSTEDQVLPKPVDVFATCWNDGGDKKKQFVSTCGTTLEGKKHIKKKWSNHLGDSKSTRIDIELERISLVSEYFLYCGAVDYHNRFRQGYLELERAFLTKDWKIRLFTSILGICSVDAFFAQLYFNKNGTNLITSFHEFTVKLTSALLHSMDDLEDHTPQNPPSEDSSIKVTGTCYMLPMANLSQQGNSNLNLRKGFRKRCSENNCLGIDSNNRKKKSTKFCPVCTHLASRGGALERDHLHAVCNFCSPFHNRFQFDED